MKVRLEVKLSAAFLAVALLLFLLTSILANTVLKSQFRDYVMGKQEKMVSDTVALLSTRYNEWGGKWDVSGIEVVGMNALGDGLILRVENNDHRVVWDARVHNGGMCAELLKHMADNMQGYSRKFQGSYVEEPYPLTVKGNQVGTVFVGYYGPYFYSDNDIEYLNALNRVLLWAAVASALVALAVGVWMARRLTRPIGLVAGTARRIAQGNYGSRVSEPSTTTEIVELTDTVNSLAETLEKQEELRRRLTADVAHELRTPLATLQSHLEAMIDGIWPADAERLKSCHEEALRLSRMVGDVERLTRLEGENLVLNKTRFNLSALLRRIALNFEGEFKSKNIAFSLEVEELMIVADEDKLSQVFVNLISNALKYTPEGGRVAVTSACDGTWAEVAIQDSGTGISAEDLPHIFERFFRADKSRSRATGGAGIGLAIVKSLVDAHRGDIAVESQPGWGSRFTVWLPLE